MSNYSPFDWINSINMKTEIDMEMISSYNPFIVNKGLSYFEDCVQWVNLMNGRTHLSKDMQYAFLKGIINKRKRFSKWVKKEAEVELEPICQYYKCNMERAAEIATLLNNEQVDIIKQKLYKGGK